MVQIGERLLVAILRDVVDAAVVVGVEDLIGVFLDRVIPELARVLPYVTSLPGLDQRDRRQCEEQSSQPVSHGNAGELGAGALIQPPCEREEEPDVGKIGVAVRHDGLTDAYELKHQRDVDEEEREPKQNGAMAPE